MIDAKIWNEASSSAGKLPPSIFEGAVVPHVKLEVNFNRESVSYADYETANIRYSQGNIFVDLCRGVSAIYIGRLQGLLSIFEYYDRKYRFSRPWNLRYALGDIGSDLDVISFCSKIPGATLLPDPEYIYRRGYESERIAFDKAKPWRERINKAYFRGTDSGVLNVSDRLLAPRVLVARKTKELDSFDVMISGIEQRSDYDDAIVQYRSLGILSDREPQERILEFKYQIDIDGNSNSWSGFFLKLLSGAPVLKIDSDFRQWYYDRLEPWRNYVPVKADLSDIESVTRQLMADDELAESIGDAGRALVRSLTYERELEDAADRLEQRVHQS